MSARAGRLRFDLLRRSYVLAAEAVATVEREREILPVPGAPPGVLGLIERRGRVLTVLDGAALLDDAPADVQALLLILQAPLGHLALRIAGPLALEPIPDDESDEPSDPIQRVEPLDLLARVAREPAS